MDGFTFIENLGTLVNSTRCTKTDPILLFLDNRESNCSPEAIIYEKKNGIIMVTFPPHFTHELQPLGVSVMGPFRVKYKLAPNDWMLSHPGKTIAIHNVVELAGQAFENSFTIKTVSTLSTEIHSQMRTLMQQSSQIDLFEIKLIKR